MPQRTLPIKTRSGLGVRRDHWLRWLPAAWLIAWLALIAPMYCYKHGLLIFWQEHRASTEYDAVELTHIQMVMHHEHLCGEGILPDETKPNSSETASRQPESHQTAPNNTLLLASHAVLLPIFSVQPRFATEFAARLANPDASILQIFLPVPTTPPRLGTSAV